MSRFTQHLGLILLEDDQGDPILRDGRCQWLVNPALRYEVGAEGSNEVIIVPANTVTDLASIPRGVWNLFPPDGPWAKAAVIHDFLYATKGTGDVDGQHWMTKPSYTRAQADDILREAMGVLGVPAWKRQCIWAAVRVGGAGGWGR